MPRPALAASPSTNCPSTTKWSPNVWDRALCTSASWVSKQHCPLVSSRWQYRWETGGQGSGVIIDPAGYILTNYHVVRGANEIRISLSDGRKVDANLVGRDAATDLAVLKVAADGLLAAEWGDSNDLEVGALVWAVGSPFGLQRSITFGILSAKNRAGVAGTVYQDFLQTDAAVNPGNSGGPLVDARGRVVGINTAIVGEAYQGISFAIPSSVARGVYERLKTTGRVERAGWVSVSRMSRTRWLNDCDFPRSRERG